MEQIDVAVIGGGQSGLATAHALRVRGLQPVVLEASERAAGSWPRYYDSLTLFSPAGCSSLPKAPFDGDPADYPHRDEVVAYLLHYVDRLDAGIRTGARVRAVRPAADGGFILVLEDEGELSRRGVVAASGAFGRPHRPALSGRWGSAGTRAGSDDAWRRTCTEADETADPGHPGSTYVNIDACRISRRCRYWTPRLPRVSCRAARRSPSGH
ncbi:FAD-dependent oxidoreductase [Streptomyces sp. NPDC002814]